ncbi:MAG: NHL repeat-containing protein [Planctomycetes bacterium]|nr:NHL repeat-containing protein [Planctomycetota bacterium]
MGIWKRASCVAALLCVLSGTGYAQEFAANHYFCTSQSGDYVREFDPNGMLVREFGTGQGLAQAAALAFGPNGHLFIINGATASIIEFDGSGQKSGEFGAIAGLVAPSGIAFGADGHCFVTSQSPDRIVEFDAQGQKVRDLGDTAGLVAPGSLCISPDGHIFVTSTGGNAVAELDADGSKIRDFTDPSLVAPTSLFIGADSKLYALSPPAGRIVVFTMDGATDRVMGAGQNWLSPVLMQPGPDGNIYVLDSQQIRVYVMNSFGVLVRFMDGIFQALTPAGICISPIRFSVRIFGAHARTAAAQGLAREIGTMSVFPGARTIMLQIANAPGTADLASLFGSTLFVFRGTDRFVSETPVARCFDGAQFQSTAVRHTTASICIQSMGAIDAGGAYSPLRLKGTLQEGSGAAAFVGTIASILRIN